MSAAATNTPASSATPTAQYTPAEERANAITGGIGLVLSIAGFVVLVTLAALYADVWTITASVIYGVTLILGYATSTFYHAARKPAAKHTLRKWDHAAIFTLIAGTYTPFMLVNLRGPWGWTFIAIVWGLAIAGIIMKFWFTGRYIKLSTAIYIAMGWMIVIAAKPLINQVPATALWLLLAGGLCYTGGALFYMQKKLPYHHAIWHVFILAGSITHYLAVINATIA